MGISSAPLIYKQPLKSWHLLDAMVRRKDFEMTMKLEVEWSTGPNMTGYYSGTETVTFDDDEEIDVYYWEERLLKAAARKLCWHGNLKRLNTTLSRA